MINQSHESTERRERHRLVEFGMRRPRAALWASALLAVVLGAATAFVSVDTDPENMLSASDPVRV